MFSISPISDAAARQIVGWRYEALYDIYDLDGSDETIQYVLDPQNNFYTLFDEHNDLIGFCSFGQDGQVPGGDYGVDALDIGMGIRPDLTGQGQGHILVATAIEFAKEQFHPKMLRITIASFNQRAQRVWEKNGFSPVQSFVSPATGREFVILICKLTNQ